MIEKAGSKGRRFLAVVQSSGLGARVEAVPPFAWIVFLIASLVGLKCLFIGYFPHIYISDELVYAETAYNIAHRGIFITTLPFRALYPPGYPTVLAPAYYLFERMEAHSAALVTNAILTSMILPLSYLMLQRAFKPLMAIVLSTAIALLPSVMVYTYVLVSENLFSLLIFAVSLTFMAALERDHLALWVTTGAFIGMAFLTRSAAVVLPVGLISALAYARWVAGLRPRKAGVGLALLAALGVSLILLLLPRAGATHLTYNSEMRYINALMESLSSWDNFLRLVGLLAPYLGFAFWATLGLAGVLLMQVAWNRPNERKGLVHQTLGVFILTSAMVVSLLGSLQNYYRNTTLLARYLDPFVPLIIILGLMALSDVQRHWRGRRKLVVSAGLAFMGLCVATLSVTAQGNTAQMSIQLFPLIFWRLGLPPWAIGTGAVLLLVAAGVFIIIRGSKSAYAFCTFLIILGVPSIIYSQGLVSWHKRLISEMGIGSYLRKANFQGRKFVTHTYNEHLKPRDRQIWSWSVANAFGNTYEFVEEKEIHKLAESYSPPLLISSKFYPYEVLASSWDYRLYDMAKPLEKPPKKDHYFFDLGEDDETFAFDFHGGSNRYMRWTKSQSTVFLFVPAGDYCLEIKTVGRRPAENPAQVELLVNGQSLAAFTRRPKQDRIVMPLPSRLLKEDGHQNLSIRVNPFRPLDYGMSPDKRLLGIGVDWVRLTPLARDGVGCK